MATAPPRPALLSCGVLVFAPDGALLLCHLTGTPWWDLPKGVQEPGESEAEAAVREAREECGLLIDPAAWTDLGRFPYRPGKDLHLFALSHPRVALASLSCVSRFTDSRGRVRPEVDAWAWVGPGEVRRRCSPALARVLCERVNLPGAFERVRRGARGAGKPN